MKLLSPLIIALAVFFSGSLLSAPDAAEPAPQVSEGEPSLVGFRKGVVLLALHWDPVVGMGGGLVSHDRAVNGELQAQVLTGASPFLAFGSQSISPAFLRDPTYSGTQTFTDLELGVTNHLGLGLSWMETRLSVTRQEQLPNPSSITPELNSRAYLEVAPATRRFYRDAVLLGNLFYHVVPQKRVDPYAVLRLGAGTLETAYRTQYDYVERLERPYSRGYAGVVGAGVGVNVHLTGAIGLKAELSGTQRITHTTAYRRETLGTSVLSFGVFLNPDNMSQASD